MDTLFLNLRDKTFCKHIGHFLPNWAEGDERIMILGAHDDDPLIGAGYIMAEAQKRGVEVFVVIFCKGNCGYSKPEQKDSIVEIRRGENERALAMFGIDRRHIIRFEIPDFSAMHHKGHYFVDGKTGMFQELVDLVREHRITRAFIPNGHREHSDHTAVFEMCAFDLIQAGDPILSDRSAPYQIRSFHQYSVWADFSPEAVLVSGEKNLNIRADYAVLAAPEVESRIKEALEKYESQGEIIKELIASRVKRSICGRSAELYLAYDPRPKLRYEDYHELFEEILREEQQE